MLEKIEYFEKNGKAVIFRCYGEGSVVELPSVLCGLPVTELADHCFAIEASVRVKQFELRSILRAEWESGNSLQCGWHSVPPGKETETGEEEEYQPLCGESIREIFLPETLEAAGDYAFYGCLNLAAIHFPASMRRLGGGSFVACNKIRTLYFQVENAGETPYCMKDAIGEIPFELEAVLENREEKPLVYLTYPEYYEESIENTPARIIEIAFHGMGYRYRQCFQGRTLDYLQYDSLFELALAQEFLPTVMKMAFHRLQTPAGLTEDHRKRYLEFLQKEAESAARWIFEQERTELLYLLGSLNYYSEESLEIFLKAASGSGAAEAVSYLMDYRRAHFAPVRKNKYSFV